MRRESTSRSIDAQHLQKVFPMKKILISLAACTAIVGCAEPQALVSDYNGDSVKIQTSAFVPQDDARKMAMAEAQRICSKGHKKRAEYASTRNLPDYNYEHLFLCLN